MRRFVDRLSGKPKSNDITMRQKLETAAAPANLAGKLVVAHFMVGNTYPYTMQDWKEDIELAYRFSLHGFVLNVGREDWQLDRVQECFDAAASSGLDFKLFISFDMSSIPASNEEDITHLARYFSAFAHHPNYLRIKGKAVISTFSGENARFGQPSLGEAWAFLKRCLEDMHPVLFIPSFFIEPRHYHEMHCLDGAFNWNGGWPTHLRPDSPPEEVRCPRLESDHEHIHHLHGKLFMAAVSPWFFTHYGPDSWNKNWIYSGDDWLYARRWQQLIEMREKIDIVQVISWNDYGESHYIGPIKGAQPNSQKWVDGYDHTAWLDLTSYFAKAFCQGSYPPIQEDKIYAWARPHLKQAVATADNTPRPDNWELTDDAFWVIVLAREPGVVEVSSSETVCLTYRVNHGLSQFRCPLDIGSFMSVKLYRDDKLVQQCCPKEFRIPEQPQHYNFNAFVAMAG